MRTRSWALLLGAIFLILAGLALWQSLGTKPAGSAAVYADGVLVRTVDLSVDGEYRVESAEGWNLLRVRDGKLAVTAASCPDGDCVRCGPRNTDPPIVCLPNRISIRFSDSGEVDGVVR
ncbi:MAG: NusG domain II-containing protein [Oscillospiraceae bacterium]|nr:NusG domain II-containing protein [Oscillospiraceae bacterium]